jgi:DNA polymerase-4
MVEASGGDPAILHVDLDAFFAAVEVLLDPTLVGRPVIVGGAGARGVVAACTYEARAFGVHSAMPTAQAQRLCPDAVFLPGRYDRYAEFSRRFHEILGRFTPLVEGVALDEAFMDVEGARRLLGTGEDIAWSIRRTIQDDLGLSASVGVATTKFVAKLASEAAKPVPDRAGPRPGAGVVVIAPGHELEFLHPLPVRSLWGVGPATHKRLARFGVESVGDLASIPVDSLVAGLGEAQGRHLHELAWARDPRRVEPDRPIKSVSHEETYAFDLHDGDALAVEALRLSDGVAGRLRRAELAGRTITIKVRFHDFSTITRSHTLTEAVDTTAEIAQTAVALLAEVDPSPGVRLLGVGVSQLASGGARQLSLLEEAAGGWDQATGAVDEIRARFGDQAVGPAALLGSSGLRVKRQGDTQWGPAEAGRVVEARNPCEDG